MPPKKSKLLVIDASVVLSAGSVEKTATTSIQCRVFLTAVRRICHRFIMTETIVGEWKRYASLYSREWWVSMASIRKESIEPSAIDDDLRDLILQDAPAADHVQIKKDVMLIEAALKADRIVASMDEVARGHFAKAAKRIERIRDVVWINPCRDSDQIIEWLEDGAEPEAKYQLFPARRRRR